MAIKTVCDYCHKEIKEVAYVIQPTDAQTRKPLGFPGYDLHYDCIVPWREKDK